MGKRDRSTNGPAERRSYHFEVKTFDDAAGVISGYANTYDRDSYGDEVQPGAFKRTLSNWRSKGKRLPILSQHNPDIVVGYLDPNDAYEDERGLVIKVQMLMDIEQARDDYARAKAGLLDFSIGFDTIRDEIDPKNKIRKLHEIRLWEVSLVTFPANEHARVTSVKAATRFADLPLAARGRRWDADAAEARVREWAGVDETPNTKYRQAFTWFDREAADTFGGYKLQIADVIDGELTVIPRAVFAAAGAVMGARGGVEIPEAEMDGVKTHLARYYAKMAEAWDEDMSPPWEQSKSEKSLSFAELMAIQDNLQAMTEKRQQMDWALEYAISGIIKSPDIDDDAKLKAIDQSLAEWHQSMVEWYGDALASGFYAETDDADTVESDMHYNQEPKSAHRTSPEAMDKLDALLSDAEQETAICLDGEPACEGKQSAPTSGDFAADVARLADEIKSAAETKALHQALTKLSAAVKSAI